MRVTSTLLMVGSLGLLVWGAGWCSQDATCKPEKESSRSESIKKRTSNTPEPALEPVGKPLARVATSWKNALGTGAPVFEVQVKGNSALLSRPGLEDKLDLIPVLQVAQEKSRTIPKTNQSMLRVRTVRFSRLKLSKNKEGAWNLRALARAGGATYKLHFWNSPGDPRIQGALQVSYSRDTLVHRESISFGPWPVNSAAALNRAYAVKRIKRAAFAGNLTPHLAFLGRGPTSVTMLGGRGISGMWVRSKGAAGYEVELELDHYANHPFRVYEECIEKASAARPTQYISESPRKKGESQQMRFSLVMGQASPLRPSRYPGRYQSAIILTDHADKSRVDKLEAFAFGRTGAVAAGEIGVGKPGFVNQELGYSKTIFMKKAPRSRHQFDDPAYRKVLDQMANRGIEIGLHSVTSQRDTRDEMTLLLSQFREHYKGRTWIDHEPQTNCEAISQSGWNPNSEWYALDRLAEAGMHYLWNVQDIRLPRNSLNMLAPRKVDRRRPVLYRHSRFRIPDRPDFVLFASTWLYFSRERFYRWFSDDAIKRLARERGLCIGHVYLENYHINNSEKGRAFIEPDEAGGFRLRSDARRFFSRLRDHMDAGRVMFAGLEEVADHMLGALALDIAYLPGGRAMVSSSVGYPLNNLTLIAPGQGLKATVDGKAPFMVKSREGCTEFWFNLKPGQRRIVAVSKPSGEPFALLQPAHIRVRR